MSSSEDDTALEQLLEDDDSDTSIQVSSVVHFDFCFSLVRSCKRFLFRLFPNMSKLPQSEDILAPPPYSPPSSRKIRSDSNGSSRRKSSSAGSSAGSTSGSSMDDFPPPPRFDELQISIDKSPSNIDLR